MRRTKGNEKGSWEAGAGGMDWVVASVLLLHGLEMLKG